MPDSEWKARIKDRLARLGFQYPVPEKLAQAMDATARAYERTNGKRPLPEPLRQVQERRLIPIEPVRGLTRDEAKQAVADIFARFKGSRR